MVQNRQLQKYELDTFQFNIGTDFVARSYSNSSKLRYFVILSEKKSKPVMSEIIEEIANQDVDGYLQLSNDDYPHTEFYSMLLQQNTSQESSTSTDSSHSLSESDFGCFCDGDDYYVDGAFLKNCKSVSSYITPEIPTTIEPECPLLNNMPLIIPSSINDIKYEPTHQLQTPSTKKTPSNQSTKSSSSSHISRRSSRSSKIDIDYKEKDSDSYELYERHQSTSRSRKRRITSGTRRIWSVEEDEKLRQLVIKYKKRHWKSIAHELGTHRPETECRQHYCRVLERSSATGRWTHEEVERLYCAVENSNDWNTISQFVVSRDKTQCQAKWKQLVNQKKKLKEWSINEHLIRQDGLVYKNKTLTGENL